MDVAAVETRASLADLRSLEVLMHIFAIWPDQRVMLCTADKDMALFWTGLRASNFMYQAGRMSFDVDPAALLPGISSQQWAAFVAQ